MKSDRGSDYKLSPGRGIASSPKPLGSRFKQMNDSNGIPASSRTNNTRNSSYNVRILAT